MSGPNPAPSALRVNKDRTQLTVEFAEQPAIQLSAEYLRVFSPSAEVQGHSPSQKKTVGGKRRVQIMQLLPIGNYAIRIVFDDMHDTGIYSWVHLRELAADQESNWTGYLKELDEQGLSRD